MTVLMQMPHDLVEKSAWWCSITGCARATATHETPDAPLDLEDFKVTLPEVTLPADFVSARVS